MKKHEEILLGGMFRPSEQNCPTREGELIESLDKIYDIPNPRVGMRVYVENTGREYIIKSLKEKTIGGVTVPDAAVDVFEEAVTFSPTDKEKLYTLDAVNSIINIGEYQNIQAVWDACKQIALNNPEVSIIKYSVKQGRTYNSGIVFQMYHYNDAIVTQYYLYGGGQKHECNVRHIVSDGTTDNWQPIQMFTSYKFENGTLYGYKYGKSESEQNKVAIVDIPNIGAGEYFVPTSGEYNIDGNTYRTIRFGNLPPPGAIVNININTTNPEIITLYVPAAPYALTVRVNGNTVDDLANMSSAGVYYVFASSYRTGSFKILPNY